MLLVGVVEAVDVSVEAVADTPPGHRIELPVQMHHAVIAVPHPHRPPSPQPPILGLTIIGLALSGPPLGLLGELLSRQRLRLGQQLLVGLDLSGAGLVECVGQLPSVRDRHAALLNGISHRRHRSNGLDSPDLIAGVVPRHAGALGEHMSPAVSVVAAAGHARRSESLDGVELAAHRLGPRQHTEQLRGGGLAPLEAGQQLRGRCIKPLDQFDHHAPIIAHPYDICQTFSC
ncbi:MAG: hypothetical protein F4011_00670 [Acidimicrobiaceae bacterium]|nr:hypothetical protein [Acidimicrobiaceae bacterium]MYL02679.1 hypothetical protein [Acidimicrobiaceae bacterium]